MNKNKLIFAIIWLFLLIVVIYVLMNLNQSAQRQNTASSWPFNIWIVWDDKSAFSKIIDNFKELNPQYKSQEFKVESFPTYEDYSLVLSNAILTKKAPDLFVINNNDKDSIFLNQIVAINNWAISPNDFRKKYKWVFADDLIVSAWEWDQKQEYLAGLPIWYETLWVFFNRRYIKDSDLSNMSSLNNKISELKKENSDIIPIWLWNWSTVYGVSDIITQYFMLNDWVKKIDDINWNKQKEALASYMLLWDTKWDNWYNAKYDDMILNWENNLDMFSKGDTYMVVWYPSMINQIAEKWYSKNFLLASPFPHYASWWWKTLINYNYFVINKETSNYDLANNFLLYLSSDSWAEKYLSVYTYYLPSLLSLESDKLLQKISDKFNIVLWDFVSEDYELSSFDKWIKNIYDTNIVKVLDNFDSYDKSFEHFRDNIICKYKKISTMADFSKKCE